MNDAAENKGFIYEFGKFVLDPHERVLLADGKPVHLTDKVFDTLLLLIEHNGRLVTKDEMMTTLWDESFVEESNLAKNISRLRKVLNTNGTSLIETLPRRGYRFAADVKEIDGETSLLVRRNLRVKITHTDEDEVSSSEFHVPSQLAKQSQIANRKSQNAWLAIAVLSVAIISGFGFYFWQRESPVVKSENAAIRLTDDPANDFWPKWTHDGRIRFFRMGSDKNGKNMLMSADGTEQTEIEVKYPQNYFLWSPDGTKAVFSKPGDKTATYLANADGSNEIALPPIGNTDWSTDSTKIVYQLSVGEDKNSELFIYSLETGKTENITNHPGFDADPSFSPDGKQIVFASGRDGNAEIYLINADGTNLRRLTNHPAWDNHPSFSPDGTQIAFPSDRENENSNVYLMNTDGGNVRRLTDWPTNETVEPGCWSPDGTKIAFYSDREGNDDIYVTSAEVYRPQIVLADEKTDLQFPSYSPDGKQVVFQAAMSDKTGELRVYDVETRLSRVLQKTANAEIQPLFSPDGTKIVFQTKIESNTEICLINRDGSGLQNLTNNAARDGSPAFSPDGRNIVFSTNRDGNSGKYNIYLMDADGGNQRQLYSAENGMSGSAAWSPDGASIFFANDFAEDGNFEIFKIRLDANEAEQRLTFRRPADGNPAVSPDGNRIAFVSNTDGNVEVYLMNSNGTGLLRLTRNPADDTTPQFSKDGKRIIFSSNRTGKYAVYEIELNG